MKEHFFAKKFVFIISFALILVLIQIIASFNIFDFKSAGIYPRSIYGLIGILFSPLIHANWNHLLSNIFPLIFLMGILTYFYSKQFYKVFFAGYFVVNILVWIFARPAFHIGASGIVYCLASYVFFTGIFNRDTASTVLALVVVFLYGGMIWGILPIGNVSFESHIAGGLVGLVLSLVFRDRIKKVKYDWENEEVTWDKRKLKVDWKNINGY